MPAQHDRGVVVLEILFDLPMEVATPRGPARVHVDLPTGPPALLLVLGHGAGGGPGAPDLQAARGAGLAAGAVVALVEQPYRVAGRRAPAPAAHLDEAWTAICLALRSRHPTLPLVAGGRSSGGRVACRTAPATGAAAVLALAFPLQPPQGRPSRAGELVAAGVPVLVVNGDRDPFGLPPAGGQVRVAVVAGADHSLRRHTAAVTAAVSGWLTERGWERLAPEKA